MKKIISLSILFTLIFMGIAFAATVASADVTATTATWTDTLLKGAMSIALLALSWLAKVIIPIISRKGDSMFDALWEYLAEQAKKIKNERIAMRLVELTKILNTCTDEVLAIAGEAKVERKPDGSIVITNLPELKDKIMNRAIPQMTNSTKDLAKATGYDIEAELENQIKLKVSKVAL